MENKHNIEDIFKSTFEGQEINPSDKVWNGINRKLWKTQLSAYFRQQFTDFKIDPALKTWNRISHKLWWFTFLRFYPNKINIYYTGAAAILLTFVSVYIFSDKSITDKNIKTNDNTTEAIQNSSLISLNNDRKTDPADEEDNKQNRKSEKVDKDIINFLNTRKENNKDNQNFNNKENPPPVNKKNEKGKIINAFYNQQNTDTKTDQEGNATAFAPDIKSENNSENLQEEKFTQLTFLEPRKALITLSPFEKQYPDTVGYNATGQPIIFLKTFWAAEVFYSPLYNQSLFNSLNSEFNSVASKRSDASSPATSFSTGININYYYKKWFIQSGLSYTQLSEQIKYPEKISDITPVNFYEYQNNGFFVNDTIWFLDMDSLLQHGDSVWVPGIINQEWHDQIDSTLNTRYDTISAYVEKNIKNQYSYFEIPVMIGFEIKQNKFSFALKGGIAAGFFRKVSGRTIHQDGQEFILLDKNQQPFNNMMFSMIFGINLGLDLSKNLTIFGEPYFRKSINSVFDKKYFMSQKFQSTGIKFGIRYRF